MVQLELGANSCPEAWVHFMTFLKILGCDLDQRVYSTQIDCAKKKEGMDAPPQLPLGVLERISFQIEGLCEKK